MERLRKMEEKDHSILIRTLFGREDPTPSPNDFGDSSTHSEQFNFFDPTLNDSQKNAVRFALASREVALIHGPPGVSTKFRLHQQRLIDSRQVKRIRSSNSFFSLFTRSCEFLYAVPLTSQLIILLKGLRPIRYPSYD